MENEVTKLALSFVEDHWQEINLEDIDLSGYTKNNLLKEIKENYCIASWVLTEVMSWGTEKDYIKEYVVENEEEIFVVKLDNKYFKINFETCCLDECEPRYKTTMYF